MPIPMDRASRDTISSRAQPSHRRLELFRRRTQGRVDGGGQVSRGEIGDGALVFGRGGVRDRGVERGEIQLEGSRGSGRVGKPRVA